MGTKRPKFTFYVYVRGHAAYYSFKRHGWFYVDDGTTAKVERPCKRCGRPPTPEGYDACLGHVPGVRAACCGHGAEEGYVLTEDRRRITLMRRRKGD